MVVSTQSIALTGATGFLGRAVVSQLLNQGVSLRALTRRPQSQSTVNWIVGDLNAIPALEKLCLNSDTIIHIAGLTKARSLKQFLHVNEQGTANLVKAAREAGVKRFILISSIAAREPHLSNYARSKRAGEDIAAKHCGSMELLVIRPPAILGPGDEATKPMLDILKKGYLPAPSGSAGRDGKMAFVYVEDVARYIVSSIETDISKPIITPYGAPPYAGWQGLADAASHALGRPVKLIRIPPSFLKIAAIIAQTANGLIFRSGFFNSGKVRELLHTDWTGDTEIEGAVSLEHLFELTFQPNAFKN